MVPGILSEREYELVFKGIPGPPEGDPEEEEARSLQSSLLLGAASHADRLVRGIYLPLL